MKSFFGLWTIVVLVCIVYMVSWPVPVAPEAWDAPENPGYTGVFAQNDRLSDLDYLDIGGRSGPEDVAIGPDGLLYIATHDGEILRRPQSGGTPEVFALTEGRPLGLEFAPNGDLYVADAYRGLLVVDRLGAVRLLANEAGGKPVLYADDVDVAADGTVYFTDASTRFGARASGGTLPASVLDLVEHSNNGRVLRYDPATEQTTVFANSLTFPNGIAVGQDGAIYVVETGTYSIWRYQPDGTGRELVIGNLPGFPDNINDAPDGTFWVGLVSPRNPVMDRLDDKPGLRRAVMRLPKSMKPAPTRYGFVFRMDARGTVTETLQDPAGTYALTTGAVVGEDGSIFVSSLTEPRLGVLRPR